MSAHSFRADNELEQSRDESLAATPDSQRAPERRVALQIVLSALRETEQLIGEAAAKGLALDLVKSVA